MLFASKQAIEALQQELEEEKASAMDLQTQVRCCPKPFQDWAGVFIPLHSKRLAAFQTAGFPPVVC